MLHTPGTWSPLKWKASTNFSDISRTLSVASTSVDPMEGPDDLSDELFELSELQHIVAGYADSHSSRSWSGSAPTSRRTSQSPVRPRSPLQPRIRRSMKIDSEHFQDCAGPAAVEAHTPHKQQEQIDIEAVQTGISMSSGDDGSAVEDADSDYFCSSSDLAAARCMWAQPRGPRRLLAFEAHAWSL